ncbi:MAG: SecD/SecF fusion protein, partial [Solirubrobacteraceae bacterium]|nr:SecD/SecF fusion protein [Solirubrobacteraceae bacterium]
QINVALPAVKNAARAQKAVGTVAQLFFYDWEPNVIGPKGSPEETNPNVTGGQAAGNAGAVPFYGAVIRASRRPPIHRPNVTTGNDGTYYLVNDKTKKVLRGPEERRADLFSESRTQPPNTRVIHVNVGTVVVQAENDKNVKNFDQYYVLNDNPALTGTDIKDPQQNFDNGTGGTGQPIVTFGFTSHGRDVWQKVTKEIAQRGARNQGPAVSAAQAAQHFAITLDNKLVSVPYIDFQQNPTGIDGSNGSQIEGGFTISSAQNLANLLKTGALPIKLKLISQSQVSATLGKQALNQGLVAGAVGFAIVALFLLLFYRVLGLIAVGALVIYAIYFFALIKLIPITLTLPGIAGLILTIGVAADANIVIFERVKEEIRGGRSIPAGIAAGYKRGFAAIIDANVVTFMTAFILFILATAGIKGFAFVLGIGTLASLFTAVLATQAILGAMGRSRIIGHPTALGAGAQKRRWTFDFMGASKWFFSFSGCILLVGALAIGGKGLHFGIDFESGTRIKTGFVKSTNENQLRDFLTTTGAAMKPKSVDLGKAEIQRVTDKSLSNGFQISTATLQPDQVTNVKAALDQRFGTQSFSSQSVGPTFGQTVANTAVIAIIVSLLVISAYIALRFEWKYAVPVLIALMHDVLITAGVYSLTGREVTASTVAALLTILGYSLYDTIIVFDRIRENVPRMPRAAFSQIVNRSMSEVLTRSLATSFCTLLPVLALLLFGGETLKDFAFALLVGVASGAYSSVFIASPVLTHWKEREPVYGRRRDRIAAEFGGKVPAYATAGSAAVEVAPSEKQRAARRLTAPDPEGVSQSEFDELVRDLHVEVPRKSGPTDDLTPEEVVMPKADGARSGRTADGAKPKRDKQRRPRNRRHGRAR